MFMAAITGVTIGHDKGDEGSNNAPTRIQFLHLHERHVHQDVVYGSLNARKS
jgi:hypothetical protein